MTPIAFTLSSFEPERTNDDDRREQPAPFVCEHHVYRTQCGETVCLRCGHVVWR